QMRTISFYRREQKKAKEGGVAMEEASAAQPDQVINLRQRVIQEQEENIDFAKFQERCQEQVATLKEESAAHTRVLSQASAALNLCFTQSDLELSDGRIEAERLLLISSKSHWHSCKVRF